ncbi:MAG: peptidoglycan DD-metalloendopeptidase family protein [Ferruginibacter sp.]|nr:peptidoglycan DD-metalloendopeptidase family protein [Ferruginibacter sp.]MBU9935404.1 peptidoglycan DD-metalloendopeptidase family protein [Ferruginibacter sp.]HQY11083.1 peptidoglycan DD-metalloendopeptidase family protein [Ferruginibacter sp.]
MVKLIFSFVAVTFLGTVAFAQQQTREELEKQRAQLKKEMEQTQKLLNSNKAKTKENLVQWKLINDKVNLQNRIIDNLSRDIDLLDNNIYTNQREINRYNKLLDTLKEEYAKSMVYAYKNRGNYAFLNFIFSAASFNDAIRRVAYLKYYRDYREKQGENILRTQELRRQRIAELGGIKVQKSEVLKSKDKEMTALEAQKLEKDKIMNELKKQGKELNSQLAAYKKQMKKVDNAINAAINRALADAKKAAIKKANEESAKTNATATAPVKTPSTTVKAVPKKVPESILLNSENMALNENFVKNRGILPWPVDKGVTIMHYGRNQLPSGSVIDVTGITVGTDIGSNVKAVFDGVVSNVVFIEDMQVVIIQHGKYFSTYSNLSSVSVQRGQHVKTGQVIGKAAANLDGIGAIDFFINDERGNIDPEKWLKR